MTFTNARGDSVEFSAASKYRWMAVDDLGGAEAVQQTVASPYQDGVTATGDSYYMMRTLDVMLAVIDADLRTAIRDLNTALNPKLGMGTLLYEDGPVRRSLDRVKVRKLPTLPDGGSRGARVQLTHILFDAYDPLYTDGVDTEVVLGTSGDSFSFPLDITDSFEFDYVSAGGVPVVNGGDVPCPLTITIEGPVAAPLVVENLTTGEKVVVDIAVLAGESLHISTGVADTSVILEDTATGERVSAFQYIDVAQTTFFLLGLGVNYISVTADGEPSNSATIRYRQRYLGL